MDALRLRRGTAADAPELARTMQLSFESYREFAPEGWTPPPPEEEHLRTRLADPQVWCLVAEYGAAMAGHVALLPASTHRVPDPDPKVAHLWQLFLRERHWGSGLAGALHAAALKEASARGFASMRLFTAAPHRRAARFYEREGWIAAGAAEDDWGLGMALMIYRRRLP